ncbi:hypothetical protein SETIT_4G102600v2 [Setaria italica]|uniref:Uncharacterized protein n=1 Tax=Setaria italica TaxID=4555 RepID=A0A368QSP1_SETIT|nr:hypothetical protein SETIT_4G102600v2 [Setaria italica]
MHHSLCLSLTTRWQATSAGALRGRRLRLPVRCAATNREGGDATTVRAPPSPSSPPGRLLGLCVVRPCEEGGSGEPAPRVMAAGGEDLWRLLTSRAATTTVLKLGFGEIVRIGKTRWFRGVGHTVEAG